MCCIFTTLLNGGAGQIQTDGCRDLQSLALGHSATAPLVVDKGFEPFRCSPSDRSPEDINLSRTPVLSTIIEFVSSSALTIGTI
jgi:hypothetical protein